MNKLDMTTERKSEDQEDLTPQEQKRKDKKKKKKTLRTKEKMRLRKKRKKPGISGLFRDYQNYKRGIKINLHGSAAFADLYDIDDMAILDNDGAYIGGYEDEDGVHHYLRHNGPEHILVFAPTRSGKGVGLVVPTLLSWMHSCVVLDIKGENWALTAGYRKQHGNNVCLRFEPSSPEGSCKYNPLAEVRDNTKFMVKDIQNIIQMVVDPNGKGLEDHWSKEGYSLLVGATYHAFEVLRKEGKVPSLPYVYQMISDPSKPMDVLLQEMLDSNVTIPATVARGMIDKEEKERSSVVSTARSFFHLYLDPIVAENTSSSDFKISDLMNHKKPVSLYIIVPPTEIGRIRPLLRLLLTQIIDVLCEKIKFEKGRQVKTYNYRLLLLLDEFPALGKMEKLEKALAFIAGYGIKAYLITQDKAQLKKEYGEFECIFPNCHVRIAYAPNEYSTGEYISKMLGVTTILKRRISISGALSLFGLGGKKSKSISYDEVKRDLMTPDEIMTLKGIQTDSKGNCIDSGEMLIFIAGKKPIRGKQILYFMDDIFSKRVSVDSIEQSDIITAEDRMVA